MQFESLLEVPNIFKLGEAFHAVARRLAQWLVQQERSSLHEEQVSLVEMLLPRFLVMIDLLCLAFILHGEV